MTRAYKSFLKLMLFAHPEHWAKKYVAWTVASSKVRKTFYPKEVWEATSSHSRMFFHRYSHKLVGKNFSLLRSLVPWWWHFIRGSPSLWTRLGIGEIAQQVKCLLCKQLVPEFDPRKPCKIVSCGSVHLRSQWKSRNKQICVDHWSASLV